MWLLKLLKKRADEKVPMSVRLYGESTFKHWLTTNSAIRSKNVCKQCNNGWMSQLEDEAMPVLSLMILGNSASITPLQQLTISVWVTKCAMLFDSMDKGEVFYDVLDRLHFGKTLSPSFSSTNIWLGVCLGKYGHRAWTDHRTLTARLRSGSPAKAHVLTMVFGCLVLQIVSIKRLVYEERPIGIKMEMMPGPWDQAAIQIWGNANIMSVQWPPALSINDSEEDLKLFSNRFGGDQT